MREEIAAWRALAEQPVPSYSAAKHEGQPLYRLARKGLGAEQGQTHGNFTGGHARGEPAVCALLVACSSGTYIRSLAHSLGMRLGCGAVLTELTREYSHPFGLDLARDPGTSWLILPCWRPACSPLSAALPCWLQVELTPDGGPSG